ncbi:hypothetical protein [Paenibacillus sp. MER 99-2]|uniref:hypothetical protein n=1 Tax=Paenibacillus sp. MER 99-2 TaxID=2939572 RepID=UPI00203D2688|nr:hypothetical protein [Paenibacillus sp. MER 99-2]MCM3175922.1 hypothetical protein [Paenibacillus sp. MER 99-2]
MKVLWTPLLAALLLSGCLSTTTSDIAEKDVESVVNITEPVEAAKEVITEEIKETAADVLARAKADIEGGYEQSAKKLLESMIFDYPDAAEVKEANTLIAKIDAKANEENAKVAAEEKKAEEARKANINKALSKLRKKADEVEGITWYYDKTTSKYDDTNNAHLYIGVPESGDPYLRLRIRYASDSWLFIDQYIFRSGDDKYTITPGFSGVNRDNSGGGIWEWYDAAPTADDLDMIRTIIASDKAILRYSGQQYYDDRTISSEEKKAFQNVLDAYEALGGK